MLTGTALKEIVRTHGLTFPLPGGGDTRQRFELLASWSAENLSLGRLAEGHFDALAILAEAGSSPVGADAIYGVWAARSKGGATRAVLKEDGWHISGEKPFCSGTGLIDRALITAEADDGYRLFDISVAEHVVAIHAGSWLAVGMTDSLSETVEFGGPPIHPDRGIGEADFYLNRKGFWFGAIGVAACWYGGARGLIACLTDYLSSETSELIMAEYGHALAQAWTMAAVLQRAADEIDNGPDNNRETVRLRAIAVRHAIWHGAMQVLERAASAAGARPICHNREQAQRAADLYVYLAQHHGPQDAADLGRLARGGAVWR